MVRIDARVGCATLSAIAPTRTRIHNMDQCKHAHAYTNANPHAHARTQHTRMHRRTPPPNNTHTADGALASFVPQDPGSTLTLAAKLTQTRARGVDADTPTLHFHPSPHTHTENGGKRIDNRSHSNAQTHQPFSPRAHLDYCPQKGRWRRLCHRTRGAHSRWRPSSHSASASASTMCTSV